MIKKILSLLRRRIWRIPVYVVLLAALVLGGVAYAYLGGSGDDGAVQTVTAGRGTVREEVSVVGRIQPTERLDLSLQGGGRVAYVGTVEGARVRKGQMLVSLSNANLQAQLAGAQASLDQQQLRLNQLVEGARNEDVAVTQANVGAATASRDNAQRALESQLRESFTTLDSTLGANVDQFFEDPRESSPRFGVTIGSGATTYFVNASSGDRARLQSAQRESVRRMETWRLALEGGDNQATIAAATDAVSYLQTYLADLATVVNVYRPDSTTQQAVYDGFKADVASARSAASAADRSITSAQSSLASASASLDVAQRQLDLKTAPAASTDVEIQEAAVRGAAAQVAAVRAQIAENAVVSPVDGIVTELSAKVGESASAAKPVVTVMADARLEIEARVPEADIAKLAVDNQARVTLDAYPGQEFAARVIYIAPAETLVDGVATYKVKLQFAEDDERLKPGMSADLDISTQTRENVVTLPQRAIVTKDGRKVVRIPDGEKTREIEVRTGIRGVDGMVEILSGIREGEIVVTRAAAE